MEEPKKEEKSKPKSKPKSAKKEEKAAPKVERRTRMNSKPAQEEVKSEKSAKKSKRSASKSVGVEAKKPEKKKKLKKEKPSAGYSAQQKAEFRRLFNEYMGKSAAELKEELGNLFDIQRGTSRRRPGPRTCWPRSARTARSSGRSLCARAAGAGGPSSTRKRGPTPAAATWMTPTSSIATASSPWTKSRGTPGSDSFSQLIRI